MGASFFPPSSGGSLAGIPDYNVFASPDGSSGGAGTVNSPKKYIYDAIVDAIDHGGGTISYADGTRVGGPVAKQGIWIRNDDIEVPGFINQQNCGLRIIGNGNQSSQFVFETPGCARFLTNPSDPTDNYGFPGIWMVGSERPCEFSFMKSQVSEFDGLLAPTRWGWDWARKPNFALEALTVTNATRSAGETTFELDMSTATPWAVVSATRATVLGVRYVTLTLTRPLTVAMSPWVPGAIITVDLNNANFPDGDYVVTSQSDILNLQGETQISVTYINDFGTDTTASVVGTVVSHGCAIGDYIGTDFADETQFVKCPQMRVTAITVDTVTVYDPYGYSPRSASASGDPDGSICKQVRGRSVTSGMIINCCSLFGKFSGSFDNFLAQPTIDYGGSSANELRMFSDYTSGGNAINISVVTSYDPDRAQVSILADPGAGTISGASFQAYDCQSQAGHVVWNPHLTEAEIYVDQWLQDSASGSLPTIVCGQGTSFASVFLNRILNEDSDESAIVIGSGYDRERVKIGIVHSSNQEPVRSDSEVVGPTNIRPALWTSAGAKSAWELGWNTIWPGGLSTPHVGVNRSLGPVQARYANLFPAFDDWDDHGAGPVAWPTGVTVTADGVGPDGASTAYKITCDNTYAGDSIIFGLYPYTPVGWSVGDRNVFAAWVKFPSDVQLLLGAYTPGSIAWDGSGGLSLRRTVQENGWQWASAVGTISAMTNGKYFIQIVVPSGAGTYCFSGPSMVYVPSTVAGADFWEFAKNFKHQPIYLPAGGTGTMEGIPFCADGGVVVGQSGFDEGTVAMFDGASAAVSASGSAAFRYNAGTDKIQYSKNGGAWTDLV